MLQTLLYAILGALLVFLTVAGALIAGYFAIQWLKTNHFPPAQPASNGAGQPSDNWWEQLQALQSRMGALESETRGALADAQNSYRLARASEERTRKRQERAGLDDDGDVGEMPMMQPQQLPNHSMFPEDEAAVAAPVGSPQWRDQMRRARRGATA